MENASKALIMAGGVLIGVLIITLAVYLFVSFGQTSADIHSQNSQKQIDQFNAQFTSYENSDKLTVHDLITVTNFAIENNKYYDNDSNYIVEVYKGNQQTTSNNLYQSLKKEQDNSKYSCKVTDYHENGRVWKIKFPKISDN